MILLTRPHAVRTRNAGARADRLATYVVGFDDHCARASPPELVFVSRDDSPVRVRIWTPHRHDVMRPIMAVLYKDLPRRIELPAAVRVTSNGTDNKGNEITGCRYCRPIGRPQREKQCSHYLSMTIWSSSLYLFHGYQKGTSPLNWLP